MVKRLIAVMLMALLIAAVASAGSVAEADEPDYTDLNVVVALITELEESEDPDAVFLDLPVAAQQAIVNAMRTAPIETTVIQVSGGASGATDDPGVPYEEKCSTQNIKVTKTIDRKKMYSYISSTYWCYNGLEITETPIFNPSARLHENIWWEFVGHVRTNETGGRGEYLHSDFAQGHFKNCVPDYGCMSYHPSIEKYQRADGSTSYISHEQ